MSIEKLYYKLEEAEFIKLIEEYKNSSLTRVLLASTKEPYYYYPNEEINELINNVTIKQIQLDNIFNSFPIFIQKQIIQSFLLNEIKSTNEIESIFSTRYDIFYCLNHLKSSKDKKIISICNAYKLFLNKNKQEITSLKDIRDIYDSLLKGAINSEDKPDGKYFRKDVVYVTNGKEKVHQGLIGENNINKAMEEFLSIYNDPKGIIKNLLISHFMLETIHPYYDGNGRLGRFLMSKKLYEETNSICALTISSAILEKKSEYYKALELARKPHEFHIINDYCEIMAKILMNRFDEIINDLENKKRMIDQIDLDKSFTKNEKAIYKLIYESSLFTDYGICNEEIMNELEISKRSLLYAIEKYRNLDLLDETKISKVIYHRIKKA